VNEFISYDRKEIITEDLKKGKDILDDELMWKEMMEHCLMSIILESVQESNE
jgi:hypothetical protein